MEVLKMKKSIIAVAATLAIVQAIFGMGCIPNAGPDVTQQYEGTGFTNIQVSGGFEVEVTPASQYSVSVTVPENWLKDLNVENTNGTLKVNFDWDDIVWNGWNVNHQPKLQVSMPELKILDVSGATMATAKGFQTAEDFKLVVSGASKVDFDIEAYDTSVTVSGASKATGQLKAHDVKINLTGASTTDINGNAESVNLQSSGASSAKLNNFTVADARVELSGASHAGVALTGGMDVFLSGASSLDYFGNPQIGHISITGASTMNHKAVSTGMPKFDPSTIDVAHR
jgi:hypothetical protein